MNYDEGKLIVREVSFEDITSHLMPAGGGEGRNQRGSVQVDLEALL